jgi:N-acetylglutamate synthase-like GNAT family acetyltransferase
MNACATLVRRATLQDIPPMLELIDAYAQRQIMLPRTDFEMAEKVAITPIPGIFH